MQSPFELSGPNQPPLAGGKPRHLVVLLHGYGSDGNDLIGLAPHWAEALPDTEFVSPHAPFPCEMGPFGHQWFSFEDRAPAAILAGTKAAANILNAFLDEALAARGLTDRELALVGFSQGTMMALYVALRRPQAVAAVVGYSGALVGAENLARRDPLPPPGAAGPWRCRYHGAGIRARPRFGGAEGGGGAGDGRAPAGPAPQHRRARAHPRRAIHRARFRRRDRRRAPDSGQMTSA